jgi:hypothetical protein
MPPKANPRKWNDVQTTIATVTVVATLGLWNLFAMPSKTVTAQSVDTVTPPPTEPPVAAEPTAIPQVKIMFTQVAPQPVIINQPQNNNKKNNNNNKNNNNSAPVTQTKTS